MPLNIPLSTTVPAGDQSGQMLARILGQGWDSLTGQDISGSAATLAHEVLASFNWVALAAVSALFVIVISQGVAGTANEGVPFGKRYSSLWMPLRFAGAMSFLAPVVKGLSIFQVMLLMAVGYSVNLANYVWEQGLDFFAETGGRISLRAPVAQKEEARLLGQDLLKSLVIQEYFSQRLDLTLDGFVAEEQFQEPGGHSEGFLVLTLNVPKNSGLAEGTLGRILIPCPSQEDRLCRSRLSAVRGLMAELRPLALAISDLSEPLPLSSSRLLASAVDNYQMAIQPYLDSTGESSSDQLKAELLEFSEAAKQNGWVTAGSYYWTISRLNDRASHGLYQKVSFSDSLAQSLDGQVLSDFDPVLKRYLRYVNGSFSTGRSTNSEGLTAEFPSLSWFEDKIDGALGRYSLNMVMDSLKSGDPVATLSSLGRYMVLASEVVIGLRVSSLALVEATGKSADSLLGQVVSLFTGTVSSFLAGVAKGSIEALGPYILLISLLLISYGFFLAYFLPALPFVLWFSGVLAWLILVMESLVAAPLWAAAHALPEGEGLAGNAGMKGYLLFLGVLLRPPLMVFGFLIAMALLDGLGQIIGHIFAVFGFSFLGESFLGLSGFMAFSAILGIAVVTATYKLFGLTSHLPERVVNWIGQQLHSLGESEDAKTAQARYGAVGLVSSRAISPITSSHSGPKPSDKGRFSGS